MDISRSDSEAIKVWLAFGGLALSLLWHGLPPKARRALLAVLVVGGTLTYARMSPELLFQKVDSYDLVHYYLNAKYFDELGYYDLYPAAILADHENQGPFWDEGPRYMAQDEEGHEMRPIAHAVARGRIVRQEKFTPERWEAFEHDVLWLQRKSTGFSGNLWRQMIQDHGFNGTLPWTLIAKPLADVVPVEHVKWLCYIDLVLLLAAVGVLAWAYGAETAMWAWLFLMISYSLRWPQVTWAFLRYDWVAALLVAMALLKKGRPYLAGVFAGYAAVLRLFPAMWMYGPFAKGVGGLFERKVNRPLLVLAFGFVMAVGALQAGAAVRFGPEQVAIHLENMTDHNDPMQLSSRRVGLALALPYRGELLPKNIEKARKQLIEEQKPLRYGLALAVLLVMGAGLRRARDDEAFALGMVPFFLLTTASYYYLVARVTLIVMHAADLSKTRNRVGLALLMAIEVFSNWAETTYPGHRVFLIGWMAWGLTAYSFLMAGWLVWESRSQADETAEPDTERAAA